ncbi:hypothetical protein BH23GEM2_BH23GEM2_09530 [soil metagenome]
MKIRSIISIATTLLGCASLQAQGSQGSCLPADDTAANLRVTLIAIASSSDAEISALRDSLRVPVTTADSVVQILEDATCQAVIAGADLALGAEQPDGNPAYVFRIGSAFAVYDPLTIPFGSHVIFLDAALRFLGLTST